MTDELRVIDTVHRGVYPGGGPWSEHERWVSLNRSHASIMEDDRTYVTFARYRDMEMSPSDMRDLRDVLTAALELIK